MSSTYPPWPATAGLIIVSINSCTRALRSGLCSWFSVLMASPLDRILPDSLWPDPIREGHLALRGLRSAEPGLGESWRPRPVACRTCLCRPGRQPGGSIGKGAHTGERDRGVFMAVGRLGHEPGHVGLQAVHPGIGVGPPEVEAVVDEGTKVWLHGRAVEQERAWWHQKPDRILHGIDMVDEVLGLDESEHLAIIRERGPGRERHPGGTEGDPGRPDGVERGGDVGARVSLDQMGQHGVAQRFD